MAINHEHSGWGPVDARRWPRKVTPEPSDERAPEAREDLIAGLKAINADLAAQIDSLRGALAEVDAGLAGLATIARGEVGERLSRLRMIPTRALYRVTDSQAALEARNDDAPTFADMEGCAPGLTGGIPAEEAVREMRAEWGAPGAWEALRTALGRALRGAFVAGAAWRGRRQDADDEEVADAAMRCFKPGNLTTEQLLSLLSERPDAPSQTLRSRIRWVLERARMYVAPSPGMTEAERVGAEHDAEVLADVIAQMDAERPDAPGGERGPDAGDTGGISIPSMQGGLCRCRRCVDEREAGIPWYERPARFVVCETCGNKRCPHATDHRLACTGSNEPGQPGSVFGTALRPAAPPEAP